ncbi:uncharacterized protein C6orf136 homolog [Xenentodon cancila]
MAASRGGVAFWVGCVRSHGTRQPPHKQSWRLTQVVDWKWIGRTRPLSSAAWALAPPNGLRYQSMKQPLLSHPLHHAVHPQRPGCCEEEWEESRSVCVLVRSDAIGLHALLELPDLRHFKPGQLHALRPLEFSFLLTTVDGSREDDISVQSLRRSGSDVKDRPQDCFRSLFETEACPAPFMYGSHFYCFHCPGTQRLLPPLSLFGDGVEKLLPAVSLCSQIEGAREQHHAGGGKEEEKLSMMYERLRIELPRFFLMKHDYTMYSSDVEFINGLLNMKTRGRVAYQLSLTVWRLLCLCYYAEARLEVLKLTKHPEDGTIKARWRIRGIPFHSLVLRFYRRDKTHLNRSYDAFSTFYLGQDGLVHCHRVEKVMPAQPPLLPRGASLLAGALVALGVQEHRPALHLLPPLLSFLRQRN